MAIRRFNRRLPRGLAALAFVAAMLAVAPAFAQYPLTSGALELGGGDASERVARGERVEMSGGGFEPGATVEIWLNSDPIHLATIRASATGVIDASVKIPASAPLGRHTLEARGASASGGTLVLETPIVVAKAAGGREDATSQPAPAGGGDGARADADDSSTSPRGSTGRTGALPFGVLAFMGSALLLAGVLLVVLARRRRPY